MNKIKLVLSVAVVLAIVGSYLYPKGQQNLGSFPGPDFFSPFMSFDGVTHEYRSKNFNGATSTPCSFLSPGATSTLLFTSFQIHNPTSTAAILTLATSSVMNATTSILQKPITNASAEEGTYAYHGTTTPLTQETVGWDNLAPNTYLTWGVEGFQAYSASEFGGTCKAEFLVN